MGNVSILPHSEGETRMGAGTGDPEDILEWGVRTCHTILTRTICALIHLNILQDDTQDKVVPARMSA